MMRLFSKSPKRRNTFMRATPVLGREQYSRKKWRPLKLDGTIASISFIFVLFGLLFTYS